MRHTRQMAAIIGVAVVLFAVGVVWAADADAGERTTSRNQAAADRSPNPPTADKDRGVRPPGMRPGRDPRRAEENRLRRPDQPRAAPGSPPRPRNGAKKTDREGKPGPPGPHGSGHPFGPPRWPHHDWESMKKADPEMFELLTSDRALERRTGELAMQYRRAPKDGREAIRKELAKTVCEHFEVRQQRRLLELKRLEEELERLRESIERRNEARKDIVSRRISKLLGEDGIDF